MEKSEKMKRITRTYPKRTPEEIANNKYRREENAKIKKEGIEHRKKINREKKILNFMLKTDVLFFHHGRSDSLKAKIERGLRILKDNNQWAEYHPYIWNRQGEGKNYMSLCLLENIFSSNEFESIYDVPLDGTYKFSVYDSGERGLGSFNRITATKVESEVKVPYVNPGAIIPITAD